MASHISPPGLKPRPPKEPQSAIVSLSEIS